MTKRPSRKTLEAPAGADSVTKYIQTLRDAPRAGHAVTMMVKASPDTEGLMVAHIGDCRHWVHIPVGAIDDIKENGTVRCGAHTHAVADLQLKMPTDDIALGYSALAEVHVAKLEALSASATKGGHSCPPGQHWGRDSNGNWGCQVGP